MNRGSDVVQQAVFSKNHIILAVLRFRLYSKGRSLLYITCGNYIRKLVFLQSQRTIPYKHSIILSFCILYTIYTYLLSTKNNRKFLFRIRNNKIIRILFYQLIQFLFYISKIRLIILKQFHFIFPNLFKGNPNPLSCILIPNPIQFSILISICF